jgi:hypothetical protein
MVAPLLHLGPTVRIRLPPAVSLLRTRFPGFETLSPSPKNRDQALLARDPASCASKGELLLQERAPSAARSTVGFCSNLRGCALNLSR